MINFLYKKDGRIQKAFLLFIFFIIILALTAIILTAQNEADSQSSINGNAISEENTNAPNEISPEPTNEENINPPVEEISSEENVILEEPITEENINPPSEETINEDNFSSQDTTPDTQNNTLSESTSSNEDSNISQEIPENASPQNGDALETEINKPELNVEIIFEKNVTRGEDMNILVNITNTGKAEANNVGIKISLPNGFKSIGKEKIGTILSGEFVTKEIEIKTDISSSWGINEIKFFITYDEI